MPSQTSVVLAPHVEVRADSYRLNNHIAASLHYLSMGRLAHEVGAVYAAMTKARRNGEDDWFNASGAGQYFRRAGHELFLHDEIYFGSRPTLLDADLRIAFAGAKVTKAVSVDAELLEFFGRLLPRLRPTVPRSELEEAMSDEEWGFVKQLFDAGCLAEAQYRPRTSRDEYQLRLVGHACLALETPRARVLFDPLLVVRNRDDVGAVRELDEGVDAIVLSHPHWDHFNIDTLLQVPRETRMLVPALNAPPSLENVDMGALLDELGFTRITRMQPWESVDVADVCVTATPFYGETSGPEVPQDWMTYHVSAGGRSFFGAVDSCHDSKYTMDEVAREIYRRFGQVDILCAPYSGFHYPIAMFTRRPFYMGPGLEQYSGTPDDAVRWTSLLGADYLVPYAGFVWHPNDYQRSEDLVHRGSLKRLRSLVKSHPRGPLVALEPGGQGFRWQGPGSALEAPPAL